MAQMVFCLWGRARDRADRPCRSVTICMSGVNNKDWAFMTMESSLGIKGAYKEM